MFKDAIGVARATGVIFLAAALTGCVPSFNLFGADTPLPHDNEWQGPTVKVLTNHITCELLRAYQDGTADTSPPAVRDLWKKLETDNFVAAIDLNLLLTHNEGLNPSYSSIIPLNAIGHGVPLQTGSSFASGMYNRTLAISGQLSGTQDNSIDMTYVVDVRKIAEMADMVRIDSSPVHDWNGNGFPNCDKEGPSFAVSGLGGDLDLKSNVNEVLTGIDASKNLNI